MTRLPQQPWMTAPETLAVMSALGDARFVGGAVRNTLLGVPVSDVDIATPLKPDEVQRRLQAAGIKTVPTGIEHGTITAVVHHHPFEVTTLRRDVSTDGRRATVAFTDDWTLDAARRDFTMNALYADADGEVFDCVGGVADLNARKVRFVGDAATRIREDYLRSLRLFRFHAWYGKGPLDEDALYAAEKEKDGIARLSGERIAKEMLKLLEAADPAPALSAMAMVGILTMLVPEGGDLSMLARMSSGDAATGLKPDGILRLAALLPPGRALLVAQVIAARWKLSNAARERLFVLAMPQEGIAPGLETGAVRRLLYAMGNERFHDKVRLAWAATPSAGSREASAPWRALLAAAEEWQRPHFPLSGGDVLALGVPEGPKVGQVLAEVESWWIENSFTSDTIALHKALETAAQKVR